MTNATKIENEARANGIVIQSAADHVYVAFDDLDLLASKIGEDEVNELCKDAQMSDKGMIWAR